MLRTAEDIATPYGPLGSELAEFIRETTGPELLCPPRRPRHRRIATATAALLGTAAISLLASAHAFAEPADQAKYLAQERHAWAIVPLCPGPRSDARGRNSRSITDARPPVVQL